MPLTNYPVTTFTHQDNEENSMMNIFRERN